MSVVKHPCATTGGEYGDHGDHGPSPAMEFKNNIQLYGISKFLAAIRPILTILTIPGPARNNLAAHYFRQHQITCREK